jgi:hypothetical protein
MNLYLIKRANLEAVGYNEYDSAVVVANDEQEARETHPAYDTEFPNDHAQHWSSLWSGWELSPDTVKVTHLGTADNGPRRVVCASFNAG